MKNIISMRASDDTIVKIEHHEKLPSAAALAREYAKLGYSDRYAVLCDYETQKSQSQRGVYMSIILRPSIFPSQAALLSSLATVAFINALEEHTTSKLGIGWVSTIYCDGKQIGNVSIEGKLDNFTSYEYIIVNFSVSLSDEQFPPRLTDLIKKVFESQNTSVSVIVAKNILNKFFSFYSNMKSSSKFMNVYKQKFALCGARIRYVKNGRKKVYKVLNVDSNDCSLIVEGRGIDFIRLTSPQGVILPKKINYKNK
jgi:BirA family biotin operon repressor/biotin-[acetyl-CoA-carboxylase] ligase